VIPRSLQKQMIKRNIITRQDLWDFIQAHKTKSKERFGGWLLSQEINRRDKMIMAIDLWNDMINQKLELSDTLSEKVT
jgi:hypothetical protein